MTFVGRLREQEEAARVLAAGSAGVLVGQNGVGKSALLEEIGRRLGGSHVRVPQSERTWAYSGLSAVSAALGGARSAGIDRILEDADGSDEHDIAMEVSRELHRIVDEPCVLLIDGLDGLDRSSEVVLSYLFARIQGTGISVLCAAVVVPETSSFAGLPQIEVGMLDPADAVALAAVALGSEVAPGVANIVAAFTGGYPWAIMHTTLTAPETDGTSPVPIPLRVAMSSAEKWRLDAYLRDLVPDVIRTLDVLALAPMMSRKVVLEVSGCAAHAVDDLIDRGIVESTHDVLRIVDQALRLALHARIDSQQRYDLHEIAARASHGDDRMMQRWHQSFLEDAEDDGDALLDAAADFVRAGDVRTAVEFAERGMRGRSGTVARAGLLIRLAHTLWAFGYFAFAERYVGCTGVVDGSELRLSAAILALRIGDSAHRSVDDAVVDAYVTDNRDADAAGCARLLAEVATIRLRRAEDDRALARIDAAIDLHPGTAPLQYLLLRDAALVGLGLPGGVMAGGELAAASRPPGGIAGLRVEELLPLLSYLTYAEEYEQCRSIAAMFLERIRRPEPSWMEQICFRLVMNDVRGEDAAAAEVSLARWQRAVSPEQTPDAVTMLMLASVEMLRPDRNDRVVLELVHRGRELCRTEHNSSLLAYFDALDGPAPLSGGPAVRAPSIGLPAGMVIVESASERDIDALTTEEQEVARLVHLGMRNREIAAELFVSVRTVELRLTRIYRKLGIRSRAHLAALLVDT